MVLHQFVDPELCIFLGEPSLENLPKGLTMLKTEGSIGVTRVVNEFFQVKCSAQPDPHPLRICRDHKLPVVSTTEGSIRYQRVVSSALRFRRCSRHQRID